MKNQFRALVVREDNGVFTPNIETITFEDLPKNEVLIKVHYSSVNFKDAVSASGNKFITHNFPHVPGVDAAGEVVSSSEGTFQAGDKVLVTGYDLGMNTWGAYGEYISVPAGWVIPLPEKLSPFEAMSYGTAGLTVGISVDNLLKSGLRPEDGKIVVSGATGGVGSLSIAVLSKLGYEVVAISGKTENDFLTGTLGAGTVIARQDFVDQYDSNFMSATDFAGAIDTVGGKILSGILKSLKYNGVATTCGVVASQELETSMLPFIIRGIKLVGIDSVEQPREYKAKIWEYLADEWKPSVLKDIATEISLEQLPEVLNNVLNGKAVGRYVVKHA